MKSLGAALLAVIVSATVSLAQTAGPAQPGGSLNDSLSFSQWVEVSQDQDLIGRFVKFTDDGNVTPAGRSRVVMTRFDGQSFRGTTDELGRFTMASIEPGFYSLSAVGRNYCFSSQISVVPSKLKLADKLPKTVELPVTPVPLSAFIAPLQRYLPADPAMPGEASSTIADVNLASLLPMIDSDFRYVISQTDGGLSGQAYGPGAKDGKLPPPGAMNIMLFYDASMIGPVQTKPDGTFFVPDVPPGNYGLLAVGRQGMAITGLRVVEPIRPAAPAEPIGDTVEVATQKQTLVMLQGGGGSYAVQTSPPTTAAQSLDEADPSEPPPTTPPGLGTPAPGLGAPGAGGGGIGGGGAGGGGGGIGGGGGLAGLAGLAALAAIAGDDDDNNAVAVDNNANTPFGASDTSNPGVTTPR